MMINYKETKIIVLLAVFVLLMISLITFFKKDSEQRNAIEFVKDDLDAKYPNADIEIIYVNEKNDGNEKYYEIKTKVTQNAQTKCPIRTHIYYSYPNQNFVSQAPEYITSGCKVCKKGERCVIAFPEEAIIASHTFDGTEKINTYLEDNPNSIPSVNEKNDTWVVTWDANNTNVKYEVEIAKNGEISSVKEIQKS